jgi:hypothetical protein
MAAVRTNSLGADWKDPRRKWLLGENGS